MVDIAQIGTDIRSDWSFNEHGDLELVSNTDNLSQAISNRLRTELDSLFFYNQYGTLLESFNSWVNGERTLEFMKIEIENRLLQDPRLREYSVMVEYTGNGNVRVDIQVRLDKDEDYSTSLILTDSGVDIIGN